MTVKHKFEPLLFARDAPVNKTSPVPGLMERYIGIVFLIGELLPFKPG